MARAILDECAQKLFWGESAKNSFLVNRNFSEMGIPGLKLSATLVGFPSYA